MDLIGLRLRALARRESRGILYLSTPIRRPTVEDRRRARTLYGWGPPGAGGLVPEFTTCRPSSHRFGVFSAGH